MATTQSYGSNSGMCAPAQQLMAEIGDEVCIQRKISAIEFMGLEGKNKYELFAGPTNKGAHVGWTHEESGCWDRIFCGNGRELTFFTHQGGQAGATGLAGTTLDGDGKPSEFGPLAFQLKKDRHWPCCTCCSRPHATLLDGDNHSIGSIDDPFSCCNFNHNIMDAQGKEKYTVIGSCCQTGTFCPCCQAVKLGIYEQGKEVGNMKRLKFTFTECCCPTQRFTVKFPEGAQVADKALLLGSQLMMDVVYFGQDNEHQDSMMDFA